MKKLITTIKLIIGIFVNKVFVIPFLKAQVWFLKNRKLIGELVSDIIEVLALLMLVGNVWFGDMQKALYYMGFLILTVLWDMRKKSHEVNLKTDSEMVIGMLKTFLEHNSNYQLVKKPDAEFSWEEKKVDPAHPIQESEAIQPSSASAQRRVS